MISPPSQFGIIIPHERNDAPEGIKKTGKLKGKKGRKRRMLCQAEKERSPSGNGNSPSLYSNNFSFATIIGSPILQNP
jgi:hypothetical protein